MYAKFTENTYFLCFLGVNSVRITEIRVPHTVQNGTNESIVLDCDYTLNNESTDGLVVKWFFNRSHKPAYQWIYGRSPIAFGILQDRINFNYVASDNDWGAHRALNIINPTTEFTGEW